MNVLILTGRFGMGHYSVAEAIKEEILTKDPNTNVDIVDIIDYVFPNANKSIYSGFNFLVTKLSKVYNLLNVATGNNTKAPLQKSLAKKIEEMILEYNADLIICNIPGASKYISAYKSINKSNVPLYTYITDVGVHGEWISDNTDMYFVSGEATKNELINRGIKEDIIVSCGIPVRKKFKVINVIEKTSNKIEVLIMGGGLGLLPSSSELLSELSLLEDVNVTIITGKNEELLNSIRTKYPKINSIGYTDEVQNYMFKSDLLITKAGGATTFEAIYTEVPLCVINPFLVQEINNAKFIEKNNIGKVIWNEEDNIVEDIIAILKDKNLLEEMKKNMRYQKSKLKEVSPLSVYDEIGITVCT